MCGIVGIYDTLGRSTIDRELLAQMNNAQIHRGPDGEGIHTEPGIGLGHRRLSIIDLTGGRQPLFNEDGSVVVVYNGEIYNFAELTEELKGLGHLFRSRCDTEVIVHAWEEWGAACVERFRGMFAFAVWDRNSQTLFLARDRLGIKPLYYAYLQNRQLVFASELKGLLAHPDLRRDIDYFAVEDYFAYGYVPEPRTILRGVYKLSPGHTLSVKRAAGPTNAPHQYWDVPFASIGPIREPEVQEDLIARLREAVNIRLIAEVPLGAFLSGGVDSSAVVAMMAGLSEKPVNTCSISFGDPSYNEATYAAEVSQRYHTNHHVEQVDADDFDLLDRLARLYDEPYADSSAIPTYRVCELARERVTVALSGDGGDETFAGYPRYRWHVYEEYLRARMPAGFRRLVFGILGTVYPKVDWAPKVLRAKSTLQALARDSLEAYFHSVSVVPNAVRTTLYSSSLRRELQGYHALEVLRAHAQRAPSIHALSMIQYLDFKTYLPGDILTKVDRASMAHSLEVRVPILDHKLVEWVSGLPPHFKLRGREGKFIFKRALERYLPREILYRPKMGFAVPLAMWLRGPLRKRVREVIFGSGLADSGLFDNKSLRHIVDRHQSGVSDYSSVLWALLMFEVCQRRLFASETSVPLRQVRI
jgi:asparagine synthase (glutamine-hydrolysing)